MSSVSAVNKFITSVFVACSMNFIELFYCTVQVLFLTCHGISILYLPIFLHLPGFASEQAFACHLTMGPNPCELPYLIINRVLFYCSWPWSADSCFHLILQFSLCCIQSFTSSLQFVLRCCLWVSREPAFTLLFCSFAVQSWWALWGVGWLIWLEA